MNKQLDSTSLMVPAAVSTWLNKQDAASLQTVVQPLPSVLPYCSLGSERFSCGLLKT